MLFRRPLRWARRATRSAFTSSSHAANPFSPVTAAAHDAAACMIEKLEGRRMFTTLRGGGQGQSNTFEYMDAGNNPIRIVLQGDITAEFIAVQMPAKPTGMGTQLVPRTPTAVNLRPAIANPPTNYGADLYAIYITKADINSSIAIALVPSLTTQFRPMMPFSGDAGQFRVINGRTGDLMTVSPDAATGSVLIGARTKDTIDGTQDEQDIFQSSVKLVGAFGLRPASAKSKLDPGVYTAPGVSIGQVLIGGTITGSVNIAGNVDLFYAGQIWTGDATGQIDGNPDTLARNFQVGGDLRNLVTLGSIGTDGLNDTGGNTLSPDFNTGVDIRVGGRVGSILTKGDALAAIGVTHDSKVRGPGTDQHEIEVRGPVPVFSDSFFEGNPFALSPRRQAPSLGDNAIFDNDTPETAQFLGTAFASNVGKGTDDVIHLDGEIYYDVQVSDRIDYYALPLLAGQTVQVKNTTSLLISSQQVSLGFLNTGVLDPEGRVVASDLSNKDFTETAEHAFRFTAKEAGVYRIAVAAEGDTNFSGGPDGEEEDTQVGQVEYTLDISRVADIALGGVVASGSIGFDDAAMSLSVSNGDLGALYSAGAGTGGSISGVLANEATTPAISIRAGNLRAIDALTIGTLVGATPDFGPDLSVPRGIVGALHGRGTDAVTQTVSVNLNYVDNGGTVDPTTAIGLDYQLVDAEGSFNSNLIANRGIGVIRAGSTGTIDFAPRIAANADARGNDGFIDEIDIRGAVGTLAMGGPQISTGPGGNLRYFHVGNTSQVFRDRFFGGGNDNVITSTSGRAFNFTDDSGTPVKITPTGGGTVTNDDGTITTFGLPGLSLLTYGIRGSGGSALLDLTLIDSGGAQGVRIDTGSNGGAGGVEFGSIHVNGTGLPVTFNSADRTFTTAAATDADLAAGTATLLFRGRRTIDVFDIVGTNLNNVQNDTDGEIVNLTADSIGTLSATSIGVGRSKTGTEIQTVDTRSTIEPFDANRSLIDVTGSAQSITARKQIGNVQVGGTIGTLSADSDGVNDKSVFEGIVAPIVTVGNMLVVNIGEGLATSGSGDFAQGGLFATGVIAEVNNRGAGSDIRGDIVSQGGFLPAVTITDTRTGIVTGRRDEVLGIGDINLDGGGSLIDSDVFVARFQDALETHQTAIILQNGFGDADESFPTINEINITGGGGMIGSQIGGSDMGTINIKHGFGIIDSAFRLTATSTFEGIDTDGYGIRSSLFDGGDTIEKINVRGDGKLIDTRSYTTSVRQSEGGSGFDSFTGRSLGDFNDLDTFLGTSKAKPKNSSTSLAGTIDDTLFSGAQNLGSLNAYDVRGSNQDGAEPTMRVSFAQSVGSFNVTNNIDGLDFTAGTVKSFSVGKDMMNSNFTASGLVQSISSGGNIKASTDINVLGTDGRVKSLTTKRAMFGNFKVTNKLDTLHVGTDFGSSIFSSSNDIGTVIIDGSMLSGSNLRAADQIASLNIGKNINEGATVRAKRISAQLIKGAVRGDIITG